MHTHNEPGQENRCPCIFSVCIHQRAHIPVQLPFPARGPQQTGAGETECGSHRVRQRAVPVWFHSGLLSGKILVFSSRVQRSGRRRAYLARFLDSLRFSAHSWTRMSSQQLAHRNEAISLQRKSRSPMHDVCAS